MAEMQIPSSANIEIRTERRGYQPYGIAQEMREKAVVEELIAHLETDINEAKDGIDRDRTSIALLRKTFGV